MFDPNPDRCVLNPNPNPSDVVAETEEKVGVFEYG